MAENEEGLEPHKTHMASTDLVSIFDLCNHIVVAVKKKVRLLWASILEKYLFTPVTVLSILTSQ